MSSMQRRSFMGSLLGTAALGSWYSPAALALPQQPDSEWLVLYRAEQADSAAFAQVLEEAGCSIQPLAADVVRQWRDGLGAEFAAGKRLLLGLGSWDDQILIQGLAAEQRRYPLLLLQHPLKLQQAAWAGNHATELLHALQNGSPARQTALEALAQRHALQPDTPALFSWVIG
jgi:hypothetical protein